MISYFLLAYLHKILTKPVNNINHSKISMVYFLNHNNSQDKLPSISLYKPRNATTLTIAVVPNGGRGGIRNQRISQI